MALQDCLIRNVILSDHVKNRRVHWKAFNDRDEDGISLTETKDEIVNDESLYAYRNEVSLNLNVVVGSAVFQCSLARDEAKIDWSSTPHSEHSYGHLHVTGPKPCDFSRDQKDQLARIATQLGYSVGPTPKV